MTGPPTLLFEKITEALKRMTPEEKAQVREEILNRVLIARPCSETVN